MDIRYCISLMIALLLCCGKFEAQKRIDISAKESFSDHIDLSGDNDGKDVVVKFVFDEKQNMLTLSLLSYNRIVVFPQDIPMKGVTKGRRIRIEHLPFVLEAPQTTRLYLSKDVRRKLAHRTPKNVLGHWMECDNLSAQPRGWKLINDYVAQTFQFLYEGQTEVTVTLRDVYLMRDISKKGKKYDKQEIFYVSDLDRTYIITIHRDPCLGKEIEIASHKDRIADVADTWHTLKKGVESLSRSYSPHADSLLVDAVNLAERTYCRIDSVYECEDLMAATNDYNAYVDSLHTLRGRIGLLQQNYTENLRTKGVRPLDASSSLIDIARRLDIVVTRSMNATDYAEKSDFISRGRELIARGQRLLSQKGGRCSAKSVGLFREAQQHFLTTVESGK